MREDFAYGVRTQARRAADSGFTRPAVSEHFHPAQAAATSSHLLDSGFALGVGTGEALNEHFFGDRWPPFRSKSGPRRWRKPRKPSR